MGQSDMALDLVSVAAHTKDNVKWGKLALAETDSGWRLQTINYCLTVTMTFDFSINHFNFVPTAAKL